MQGFVKLKELFYAGSHGMDIVGPTVSFAFASNNTSVMKFMHVSAEMYSCQKELSTSGSIALATSEYQATASYPVVLKLHWSFSMHISYAGTPPIHSFWHL